MGPPCRPGIVEKNETSSASSSSSAFPFQEWAESRLARRVGAGGFIGGVTGMTVGVVDGARVAGLSAKDIAKLGQQLASRPIQRLLVRHQLLCVGWFSAFYATYQGAAYLISEKRPDLSANERLVTAGALTLLPMSPSRVIRRNLPFALMIVGLDIYHGGLN